ncbi:MAG: glutamate racemase [Bacteroidetes bacterium]|nr:MAG: glutamate racemase [Bacteroidota bacterium]
MNNSPIGIFDSGIGGLTVVQALHELMPAENVIYFADSIHLPYGEKTMDEIYKYSKAITEYLLSRGCKIIVIACNTASAASLKKLREEFPSVTFIGMEPAVKPAAEQSLTKAVGVIATTATFQGELFASVVERFAQGVDVLRQPCPGLVQQIEAGELDTPETETMLRGWVEPMLKKNIDALVLGCTHYPFVKPLLEKICGPSVRIIDPAPAVARRTRHLLEQENALAEMAQQGIVHYYTSGPADEMAKQIRLLRVDDGKNCFGLKWVEGKLVS